MSLEIQSFKFKMMICPDEDGRLTLTGIGCSAGTFDGIARVITSLDEQHLVKEVRF